jgi:hypothetical protein
MIRGMASKFVDQQTNRGFEALFGRLKPKSLQQGAGAGGGIFGIPFSTLKGLGSGNLGKDAALQANTSAIYQLTQAISSLASGGLGSFGGGIGAPGASGGGFGGVGSFVSAIVGAGASSAAGSAAGSIMSSVGAGLLSERPHVGDSSGDTYHLHFHGPTNTGEAKRHARAITKEMDMRKARYG